MNRDRSRYEQIKRFVILPRDFTVEEGEVTPTLKLKRRVVQEHFAREIERAATAALEDPARADVASTRTSRVRLEILTTSPVCGAWMNWPPPM